jgi:hypothetical protein
MINESTVEGLIQEMIDWNEGTLTKGYDDEERAEAIANDTREFVRAILIAHDKEVAL